MKLGLGLGLRCTSKITLPRSGLIFHAESDNNLIDAIGGTQIHLATGTIEDLINASWSFQDDPATRQIDTLLGGDAIFDSLAGMDPITRYGYEWAALDNINYLFTGYNGIAGYSAPMLAMADRITRVLLLPTIMLDSLELLDELRMVR